MKFALGFKGKVKPPRSSRTFEPVKGKDSKLYPKIWLVKTTVQRKNANYFGQFINSIIEKIPAEEIEEANKKGEPVVLIIGSRQYLRQIEEYLTKSGRIIESRQDHKTALFFERGLELLKENPESNLGWRIILQTGKRGLAISVVAQADSKRALHELIPDELKKNVLAEAEKFTPANTGAGDSQEEATKLDGITIKLTSFEGAKGMSAQHIFLVGLHAGELPKDAKDIQDLEICKFLVGLTRTKKRCSILWTRCFGQESKQPSVFIDWIQTERYELLSVDAKYWKRRHTPSGKGSSLFQKFVAATQKRRHRF